MLDGGLPAAIPGSHRSIVLMAIASLLREAGYGVRPTSPAQSGASREIRRRVRGAVRADWHSTMFEPGRWRTVAESRGSLLPGVHGDVHDTAGVATEDNERPWPLVAWRLHAGVPRWLPGWLPSPCSHGGHLWTATSLAGGEFLETLAPTTVHGAPLQGPTARYQGIGHRTSSSGCRHHRLPRRLPTFIGSGSPSARRGKPVRYRSQASRGERRMEGTSLAALLILFSSKSRRRLASRERHHRPNASRVMARAPQPGRPRTNETKQFETGWPRLASASPACCPISTAAT